MARIKAQFAGHPFTPVSSGGLLILPGQQVPEGYVAVPVEVDLTSIQVEAFRKGAEYAFWATGINEGLTVGDEEAKRELYRDQKRS